MVKKILVVDDEPDILKVVLYRLQKEGFEIKTAIDGKEALDIIHKESFDLILLDITLPELNGWEVCRNLKSDEKVKHIPVIFLTASMPTEGFEERAQDVGVNGYVFKPFEYKVLLEEIKKY